MRERLLELAHADPLPAEALQGFEETLVRSLDRGALIGALAGTISVLLRESADAGDAVAKLANPSCASSCGAI